jgi:DNA recombination protein RmuC
MNPVAGLVEPILFLLLGLVLLLGLALVFALRRRGDPALGQAVATLVGQVQALSGTQNDTRTATEARIADATKALTDSLALQAQAQATLLGQQQSSMSAALATLNERLGKSLAEGTEKTQATFGQLAERLATIDAAQKNLATLSAQVGDLQSVLSGQKARGAFGEAQLEALVRNTLAPDQYEFQASLGAGRVDCLLLMPNPPGPIPVDSKFPLEGFRAWREAGAAELVATRTRFATDVRKHVRDIATKYIIEGVTADSALMFVPSEAVYATLHTDFQDVVEDAWARKVWIVSPTTLMAILNTMVAVMRDVRRSAQTAEILAEVRKLLEDVDRLGDRVEGLKKHFAQAEKDIRDIDISTDKISKRGAAIKDARLEAAPPTALPGA